ncbi:MAG: enoyl-CoA hydratase/isomerase family protein [Bdellovibrionales bacterium]|nr:enoyl-CoA hydratase/isomerase family protein [Bdellovibrionales bacterium]
MEFIKYEKDGSIGWLTVNKPQALNALSSSVLKEMKACLEEAGQDKDLRCLVITGAGDKAFVAGADIKEIHGLNVETAAQFAGFGQDLFTKIENFPVPVIAAVNGFALGGGLELALACDFIYASENAKFGLPECTLGLMPGFGGSVRLARKIGPNLAKEWTFTGDMHDADKAKKVGLVNKVCDSEELLEKVTKVAHTIAKRAPLAIAAIKHTIDSTYGMDISAAMKVERQEFAKLFSSQDVKEGTQAFIEKRKPEFKGI